MTAKAKILLCDDESTIKEVAALLRSANYEVVEAPGLDGAAARVAEAEPDLIILNWFQTGHRLDGPNVAKQILEANPKAKVLVYSHYAVGKNKTACLKLGAIPLDKATPAERLLQVVERMLRARD